MKRLIAAAMLVFTVAGMAFAAVPVSAAALPAPIQFADAKGDACAGIGLAGGSCTGNGSADRANTLATTLINVFSVVVGVIAVVMIIIAGAKFITSNGDTSKVASAKTSIIYAIVGLIIVVLAQTIVHYVITKAKV